MPHAAGLSRIGQVVENLGQNGEGADVAFGIHRNIREGKRDCTTIIRRTKKNVRQFTPKKTKNDFAILVTPERHNLSIMGGSGKQRYNL